MAVQAPPKSLFLLGKDRQVQPQNQFQTNFGAWMDRLMRPLYASAGLAKEVVDPGKEFNPGEELWKGITGQEKETYTDVLDTVGWRPTTKIGKFARGVMGFGLDVILDPLTYVGIGTLTKSGRVASKTGKLAVTAAQQAQQGQRAALSFMGAPLVKGVPVFRKLGQVGEAARKVPQIENLGKAFVPGYRPAGVTAENWAKLLKIKRRAKAIQRVGDEKALSFATGILDDMKKMTKTGKITDKGVKELLEAVERRSLSAGLPDSAKPLWDKLVKYADTISRERQKIGKTLLDEVDYSYWFHGLSQAERDKMRKLGLDIAFKDWTTKTASDLSRQYVKTAGKVIKMSIKQQKELIKKGIKIEQATIGEVNKALGKEFFSTDIPFTSYVMGKRISRQKAGTHFFRNVKELGSEEALEGWVKSSAPELEGLYFNPHVAKEIDALKKAFVGEEVSKQFLQGFDSIQNYWKKWTLGPFPAYHFRNMIGNAWNNYLAGVKNPAVYKEALELQRKHARGQALTAVERKIMKKAVALGVVERGWFTTVMGSKGAPQMYKPARTVAGKVADAVLIPAEAGLRGGRLIENNARLAHFIDKIKKGWSYDEAALSVKKYLFDYTELTPFEINVMRRLMPFYTWSRKNIPLQLEHIMKKPGKTIVPIEKARRGIAGGPEPERKYLPEWLGEKYPFRVGQTEKGVSRYFPLESWLPIADVMKAGRPAQAAGELVSPLLKVPTELMLNRSFYFDKPIRKYPGERKPFLGVPLPAKTEYVARNLRLLAELNRLFQKPKPTAFEATKIDKAVRALTGIKTYPQRITEMKRWSRYNIDQQLFELKNGYNRAKRNGDFKEALRIKRTINKLESIQI